MGVKIVSVKCAVGYISREVMTIREKFADSRLWKSKYKGVHTASHLRLLRGIVRDCECLLGWSGSFTKLFSDSTAY